jgi:hypothetical protein
MYAGTSAAPRGLHKGRCDRLGRQLRSFTGLEPSSPPNYIPGSRPLNGERRKGLHFHRGIQYRYKMLHINGLYSIQCLWIEFKCRKSLQSHGFSALGRTLALSSKNKLRIRKSCNSSYLYILSSVKGRDRYINCSVLSQMKTLYLSLLVASLVAAVPLFAKDGGHGKDTAPGQLKKILKVPDSGSTLTLLGISFVSLAAFGRGLQVNAKNSVE